MVTVAEAQRRSIHPTTAPAPSRPPLPALLQPDPILSLQHIVGYSPSGPCSAVWTTEADVVAYAAGQAIVFLDIRTGVQQFLQGHTADVVCLSVSATEGVMATAQGGVHPCVRLWDVHTRLATGVIPLPHSPCVAELSSRGTVLISVTRDGQGKHWVAARAIIPRNSQRVRVLAEARADASVEVMRVSPADEHRFVSCGRDNIRLWRIKDGAFRSCPVSLLGHTPAGRADICYTDLRLRASGTAELTAYVASTGGEVLEVDCMASRVLRRHCVAGPGDGALRCLALAGSYCVVGSDDMLLRVWPLDFGDYIMDLEHETPPCCVAASDDGQRLVVGTVGGTLGVLDLAETTYRTVLRAHVGDVVDFCVHAHDHQVATASADGFVRVWDMATFALLYEFSMPDDAPRCVAFHPRDEVLAVGYASGHVRVFSVKDTAEVTHIQQHTAAGKKGISERQSRLRTFTRTHQAMRIYSHARTHACMHATGAHFQTRAQRTRTRAPAICDGVWRRDGVGVSPVVLPRCCHISLRPL